MVSDGEQPSKAEYPISVTLFGIVTFTRKGELKKANQSIFLTPSLIITVVSFDDERAFSPIFITGYPSI